MTTEEKEYSEKLQKIEKINLLKIQRDSDSSFNKRNTYNTNFYTDDNSNAYSSNVSLLSSFIL